MSGGVALALARRATPRLPRLGGAAALWLVCTGSGVALLATAGFLIQRASLAPPILSLAVATTAVRLFSLLRASSRYLERLATHDAVLRLLEDTRVDVFKAVEPLAPGGFDRERSGDVMRRITADVDSLQDFYARSLLPPVAAVLSLGLLAAIAGMLSARLGVTVLVSCVALGLGVVGAGVLGARGAAGRLAALSGVLAAEVTETLQGCADLAGVGALDARLRAIDALNRDIARTATRLAWSRSAASALVSLATGLTVLAVLVAAISAVNAGALDAVVVGAVALGALAVSEPFSALATAVEGARSGLASGERLQELSRRPQPVPDPVAPLPAPAGHTVEVSGVSLRYAPDGLPALDSVSVRLSRGRRIGIVGASGSGKSTLASLLVRFREFEGGTFTIDGIDVRSLDAADVRRHIGLVAQDAHVFATSVRENLRLARPGATDDELRDALRRAQLLGWVDSLPAGWDTRVGEHGARISGGQRRRLCIARALLARFPVLIVDEPTEALDASTAAALMAALLEATRDSALLVISHRAADMRGMDEVLTMRDGRLTRLDERG